MKLKLEFCKSKSFKEYIPPKEFCCGDISNTYIVG